MCDSNPIGASRLNFEVCLHELLDNGFVMGFRVFGFAVFHHTLLNVLRMGIVCLRTDIDGSLSRTWYFLKVGPLVNTYHKRMIAHQKFAYFYMFNSTYHY